MNVRLRLPVATVTVLWAALLTAHSQPADAEIYIQLSTEREGTEVLQSGDDGLRVLYAFSRILAFEVQTERGPFTHIDVAGLSHSTRIGHPKLPVRRRIISVPLDAAVSAEAVHYDAEEVVLPDHGIGSPVMPAQPPLPKSLPASAVPFAYEATAYAAQGYDDRPLVHVEELGVLRGLRLFLLVVEPVKYDPTRQTLLVYNNLEVDVRFAGGDVVTTRELRRRTWSPCFESLYGLTVLNYEPIGTKDDLTRYPVKYIIISDAVFETQLQPFIEWKTQKGFDVTVGYVGDPEVGSTTGSIKNYIQGLYDAGTPEDPAPSFVLFVGDVDQVPTWSGATDQHVSDLHYVMLAGADYMPEMYYGRFSASTASQLQPQIDKTLEYERYEMPDPSFLGEAVMIGGMDPDYAQTWANGQINYGTTHYFDAAHGIASHTYLYPGSGSHASDIINDVSNGVGYANYTAHGYEMGWGNPAFTISDIEGLGNAHKYPTAVGNCCLTNRFSVETCFGEAWLRADGKGAVGYIGATNYSYWDQDYWWGVGAGAIAENPTYESTGPGAYDGMFHDHGEPFPEWYATQYSFIMAGCLAVAEADSSVRDYYWEVYTLMGDPSLSTYFGVPATNVVGHPTQIAVGDTFMEVTADPWSYVGLSQNGELYAAGLVDDTGQAALQFDVFTTLGEADLVITRQNRQPVITTVQVIPASGPYVVTANVDVDDTAGGNGNGQADFGETLVITLTEECVGAETSYGVNVRISTSDPCLAITDSTEYYGDIPPGQQVAIAGGFEVVVATDVPDNHPMTINVAATDNAAHRWNDSFTITAYAPSVNIATVAVDDAAGDNDRMLDQGETATLELGIYNGGGAPVVNVVAVLSSVDPYVTINDDTDMLGSIAGADTETVYYSVTVDSGTPAGHSGGFDLGITGDNYATSDTFSLPIGILVEDFENGDFASYPWAMGGDASWGIVSSGAYEGDYCAASGDITDLQTSDMSLTAQVVEGGTISFHYKVSSEANFDYLRFLIDGVEQGEWSGLVDWNETSYTVTQGTHTFLWRYEKDWSVDAGHDCAWLDCILFPPLGEMLFPEIDVSPASFEASMATGQTLTEQLTIANTGDADLTYTISVSTQSRRPASGRPLKLAKGEPDPRAGEQALKGSGGPDGYGYTWIDSDEPGGASYEWVDISSVGATPGADDDGNYGPVDLAFPFRYYGTDYTAVRICTNGYLSLTSSSTEFTNQGMPRPEDPNSLLAPFWDDLDPSSGGTIYYYSDQANERFIVQWDQVPHYDAPPDTGTYTFQVILHSDGQILYQYKELVGALASCTVGIENAEGTDGLEVVFNRPYLHDSLAILFKAGQPWLTVIPQAGTVEPDSADELGVTFDAAALAQGTYAATITVNSNDPDEPSVAVPVAVQVRGSLQALAEGSSTPTRLALTASPNPFSSACRFANGTEGALLDEVMVFDLRGNLVWRSDVARPQRRSTITWCPAPSVGNGMYVARATVGNRSTSRRVVYLR